MFEEQEIVQVTGEELLDRIRAVSEQGYRLVQISCTQVDQFQIDYTFDKDLKFLDFRLMIPVEGGTLPSITGIYGCAFTYENEIHDLFGVNIEGISLDFGGNFYRIPVVAPFKAPLPSKGEAPEGDQPKETPDDKE